MPPSRNGIQSRGIKFTQTVKENEHMNIPCVNIKSESLWGASQLVEDWGLDDKEAQEVYAWAERQAEHIQRQSGEDLLTPDEVHAHLYSKIPSEVYADAASEEEKEE